MKKNGILHPELMKALTSLGHTDEFMVCDPGFPIPQNVQRIDLAFIPGVPTFSDCIKAIVGETVIEGITIAEEMEKNNPVGYDFVTSLFKVQEKTIVKQEELLKKAQDMKFIVRCADFTPYSNIVLRSASGCEGYYNQFVL